MAEAAYADLETLGQVLNEDDEDSDRNTHAVRVSLAKKPVGRHRP
jgi:hypothetical protein